MSLGHILNNFSKDTMISERQLDYLLSSITGDINRGEYNDSFEAFFNARIIDALGKHIEAFDDGQLINFSDKQIQNSKVLTNVLGRKIANPEILEKLKILWSKQANATLAFQLLNDKNIKADLLQAIEDFIFDNFEEFKLEESLYENPEQVNIEKYANMLHNRINKSISSKKWVYLYSFICHPAVNFEYFSAFLTKSDITEFPFEKNKTINNIKKLLENN